MHGPPPFDIPVPPPRAEPTPRWVRVRAGDTLIADSRRAQLLAWYGPGMLPTYCFPSEDVRVDLMRPTGARTEAGAAVHDLHVGDRVIDGVAQRFDAPPGPLAALRSHWTFAWDGRVTWFEEALELRAHARDPSKRVDVVPSDRHIRIALGGAVLAESRRPHALFETTLPTRWYLPLADVRPGILTPSETVSVCPYKGVARWFSARAGGTTHADVAWSYPDPVPECPAVAGLVAFLNEKVDLTIDGEPQRRPFTPWSR